MLQLFRLLRQDLPGIDADFRRKLDKIRIFAQKPNNYRHKSAVLLEFFTDATKQQPLQARHHKATSRNWLFARMLKKSQFLSLFFPKLLKCSADFVRNWTKSSYPLKKPKKCIKNNGKIGYFQQTPAKSQFRLTVSEIERRSLSSRRR